MSDTVEISREDWDKLIRYHKELFELVNDIQDGLETILLVDIPNLNFYVSPETTAPTTKKLTAYYAKLKPWMKFLFVQDYPFSITPIKGED